MLGNIESDAEDAAEVSISVLHYIHYITLVIRTLTLTLLPFVSQEFEPQDEGDNDDDEIVESEDDDDGPPAKKLKTDDSDDE